MALRVVLNASRITRFALFCHRWKMLAVRYALVYLRVYICIIIIRFIYMYRVYNMHVSYYTSNILCACLYNYVIYYMLFICYRSQWVSRPVTGSRTTRWTFSRGTDTGTTLLYIPPSCML